MMINCRICGGFISYDWSNLSEICASCKHKSDWIKAEYEVMGWPKVELVAIESLIKEEQCG